MGRLHERREKCYEARDTYWRCVDDPKNYNQPAATHPCNGLLKEFEGVCPPSWVKYFGQLKDRERLVASEAAIGEIRNEM